MLKNLIDLRSLATINVPTLGKELPEFVRYTQVSGIGRNFWAMALDDLLRNLRVPESMKWSQSSQHLDATLHFSP